MTVDERKQRVLEAIVALYAMDGEPVGSSLLSQYLNLAVSSATLRNEMAALTRLGLLEQPHTSAGRVPSPQGYRYYLDRLLADLPVLDAGNRRRIDRLFEDMDIEPDRLARAAARALAMATGLAATVTTPRADDAGIAHFDVVQVGLNAVVVLGVTGAGGVLSRAARVAGGLENNDAAAMAAFLNRSIAFISPADLTDSVLGQAAQSCPRRLLPILAAAEKLVHAEPQVYLEGAQSLLQWPETRRNLGKILDVFANGRRARALIAPEGSRVTVTLGEDLAEPMNGLCIVSKRYLAGGGRRGTVAVLGSSRMNFRTIIPVLDYFALKLGQSMSGQNQEAQL